MIHYHLDGSNMSAVAVEIEVGTQRIVKKTRLADGSLAEDAIAVKRSWKFSYSDLPGLTANVIDGGLGRDSIKSSYNTGGVKTLTVPLESGSTEAVSVMFAEQFTEKRVLGEPFWRWDLSFTLDEV